MCGGGGGGGHVLHVANNLWYLKRSHLIILCSAPFPSCTMLPTLPALCLISFLHSPSCSAFPSSTAECNITRDLKKLRLTLLTVLKKLGLELLSQHIQTAAEACSKIVRSYASRLGPDLCMACRHLNLPSSKCATGACAAEQLLRI